MECLLCLSTQPTVYSPQSIATLPPFGPIEGHKWLSRFLAHESLRRTGLHFYLSAKSSFYLPAFEIGAGIFKESMGARNRGGNGSSYRPAGLHRLAEFIPWNRFLGSINVSKYCCSWLSTLGSSTLMYKYTDGDYHYVSRFYFT
jgi:hypothetical protein